MAITGGMFSLIGGIIFLVVFAQAVAMFLAGRWLTAGRNRMFCFLNACLMCTHVPFGTALGIFTIVVLSRPSVIQRFEANQYGGFPPQPSFKQY
jgi:hypothetical protein